MKTSVDFVVEKETEKAVYVCTFNGRFAYQDKYNWLPKSACDIVSYVQTVNALNEPETYGKRVVAIESWLEKKLRG